MNLSPQALQVKETMLKEVVRIYLSPESDTRIWLQESKPLPYQQTDLHNQYKAFTSSLSLYFVGMLLPIKP